MYHLGKILKIFGVSKEMLYYENSVQAFVEMWDGNKVIVLVSPLLATQVSVDDFVLVRYAQPEPTIWKILKPKEGKELWEELNSHLSKRKLAVQNESMNVPRPEPNFGKMIG